MCCLIRSSTASWRPKFVNNLMRRGKKSLAERVFYEALAMIERRAKQDPLDVFQKALDNVRPVIEVKSRRVGGATYQVPVEVRSERRDALAMRWIIGYAKSRSEKTMTQRLAGELQDAAQNRGGSVKKREDTHRMAEANKALRITGGNLLQFGRSANGAVQQGCKFLGGIPMGKKKFERTKPHVNVGTIGHIDHGKTLLRLPLPSSWQSAGMPSSFPLIRSTRRPKSASAASPSPPPTSSTKPPTHYAHVDCPGHADYIKNMITGPLRWTALSWRCGRRRPDAQTREHILLARQVGVPYVVVFLNKVDMVTTRS